MTIQALIEKLKADDLVALAEAPYVRIKAIDPREVIDLFERLALDSPEEDLLKAIAIANSPFVESLGWNTDPENPLSDDEIARITEARASDILAALRDQ